MDNTNDENLIVSPLSVLLVLAMAAFGAAGNTAVQMRRALHIPCEDKLGLCGFRTMLNVLNVSVKNQNLYEFTFYYFRCFDRKIFYHSTKSD